jgi:hypothetical protein
VLRLLRQWVGVEGWANRRTCAHPSKGGVRMCSPSSPPTPPRTCSPMFACSPKMFACSPLTPAHAGSSRAICFARSFARAARTPAASVPAHCRACWSVPLAIFGTSLRMAAHWQRRCQCGLRHQGADLQSLTRLPMRWTTRTTHSRGRVGVSVRRECLRLSKDTSHLRDAVLG